MMEQKQLKYRVEGCPDHRVCYLRFSDKDVVESEDYRPNVVLDYDKSGMLVGIEFTDGITLELKHNERWER